MCSLLPGCIVAGFDVLVQLVFKKIPAPPTLVGGDFLRSGFQADGVFVQAKMLGGVGYIQHFSLLNI
jgi:hypothetical protein